MLLCTFPHAKPNPTSGHAGTSIAQLPGGELGSEHSCQNSIEPVRPVPRPLLVGNSPTGVTC